jgi:serine/threonine protein kinase
MVGTSTMTCPSCHATNDAAARSCFACGAPLEPGLADLTRGALFAGRYEILAALGRGGMGMVYKARDRQLGETVAIKILRPDVARQSDRVESRFRSEIRLARKVRHPNVCSVYGDGEDRGLLYICMELVEGENLARVSRATGGLPWPEAWDTSLQVADGLGAIHAAGVIHRDLKTANIMRDGAGVVRVMDFGIAKMQEAESAGITATATGGLMGTPEYMSPEHIRGDNIDYRSDLYSLGVVVHELFTGGVPLRGETALATVLKQLEEPPDLTSPRLPPALVPVLARALAKNAARRFATSGEMKAALLEARAASPAEAPLAVAPVVPPLVPPTSTRTRPLPPRASRVSATLTSIVAALLAVVASGAYLLQTGRAAPPKPTAEASAAPALPAPAPASVETPAPSSERAVGPSRGRAAAGRRFPAAPSPSPVAVRVLPAPTTLPAAPVPTPLPPEAGDGRIYEEDEVDVPPRRLAGFGAPYPDWGPRLAPGESVSISASFVVTEAGDVTDIRVESGGGALEAVLVEMSRWKYEPGLKDGAPVKVRLRTRQVFVGG